MSAARAFIVSVALIAVALPATPAGAGAFQGQNGKIAYIAGGNIFTVNPDGTGVTNITQLEGLDANALSVSPDGKRIAFTVEQNELNDAGLYVINMDGSGVYDVLAKRHDDFIAVQSPAWSNDGRRLAFEAYNYPGFTNELYVVGADGSNLKKLTNCDCASSSYPVWSPVANEIAFVPCCSRTLTIVDAGSGATREVFTYEFGFMDNITWSPDGTQFAFDDLIEVYRVNADGTGLTELTTSGPGYYSNPSWSPDGTKIAVESNHSAQQSNNRDIYAIDAATGLTGGITRITTALDSESNPEWGALCTAQCTPTSLDVTVTRKRTSLKVDGEVVPAGAGSVAMTLSRKTGSGWKKVKSVTVGVAGDGTFKASLPRPDANKCRLEARYGGDADHEPSSAAGTFNC